MKPWDFVDENPWYHQTVHGNKGVKLLKPWAWAPGSLYSGPARDDQEFHVRETSFSLDPICKLKSVALKSLPNAAVPWRRLDRASGGEIPQDAERDTAGVPTSKPSQGALSSKCCISEGSECNNRHRALLDQDWTGEIATSSNCRLKISAADRKCLATEKRSWKWVFRWQSGNQGSRKGRTQAWPGTGPLALLG